MAWSHWTALLHQSAESRWDVSVTQTSVFGASVRRAVRECVCLMGDFLADWGFVLNEWWGGWFGRVRRADGMDPSSVYSLNQSGSISLSFVTSILCFFFSLSALVSSYPLCHVTFPSTLSPCFSSSCFCHLSPLILCHLTTWHLSALLSSSLYCVTVWDFLYRFLNIPSVLLHLFFFFFNCHSLNENIIVIQKIKYISVAR